MERKCNSCKKVIDAALVKCPFCGAVPSEEIEQRLTPHQIRLISKRVRRELIKIVAGYTAILTAIFGYGLLQIYTGPSVKREGLSLSGS